MDLEYKSLCIGFLAFMYLIPPVRKYKRLILLGFIVLISLNIYTIVNVYASFLFLFLSITLFGLSTIIETTVDRETTNVKMAPWSILTAVSVVVILYRLYLSGQSNLMNTSLQLKELSFEDLSQHHLVLMLLILLVIGIFPNMRSRS